MRRICPECGGTPPYNHTDECPMPPRHTVNGKTSEDGWPYGTIHDMDCPGCKDVPYLASPRSEAYWSS